VDSLVIIFQKECERNWREAGSKYEGSSVEALVRREFAKCNDAITTRNVDSILRLFEGKELLKNLLRYPGCDSHMSLLSATVKHALIADFPHLKQLSDSLNALFN